MSKSSLENVWNTDSPAKRRKKNIFSSLSEALYHTCVYFMSILCVNTFGGRRMNILDQTQQFSIFSHSFVCKEITLLIYNH